MTTTTTALPGHALATTLLLGTILVAALLVVPKTHAFGSLLPSRKNSVVRFSTSQDQLLLMEEQAGGHSSNRRRRKQRIQNSQSDNSQESPSIQVTLVGKPQELPDPLVDFDSIQSFELQEDQIELTTHEGESILIDPRDLHQTSDFDLWMALRRNLVDVSASQLSVVLGTNYFQSRESLKQEKIKSKQQGQHSSNNTTALAPRNKACEWGIRMEPLAFAQYSEVLSNTATVEETGMYLLRHTDDRTNKTYVFGASPDGIVREEDSVGLLEIKSLWGRRKKGSLPEFSNCPSRFYDQLQGQMAICDMDWCDLMLFIPPTQQRTTNKKRKGKAKKQKKPMTIPTKTKGKNYSIVRVKRNEKYWNETVLPALVQFCDEVQAQSSLEAQ